MEAQTIIEYGSTKIISEKRISYWGDIFMFFNKITKVTVRGSTVTVYGIKSGVEQSMINTYQHKKVATALAKKLRNLAGI